MVEAEVVSETLDPIASGDTYEHVGYDVAISGNGEFVVATKDGVSVPVFKKDSNGIYNSYTTLNKDGSVYTSYDSIAVSDTGRVIAVISLNPVKILHLFGLSEGDTDDTKYIYRGSITDTNPYEVAVSGDGKVVAFTNMYKFPQVKKLIQTSDTVNYEYEFQSMGSLDEVLLGSNFGFFGNVALSHDGKTMAIRDKSSVCKILSYNDSKGWEVEYTIQKTNEYNLIYNSMVSIASDGRTVAVGDQYDNDSTGRIRVYSLNENDGWEKFGSDIKGNSDNDRLFVPALSEDGTYLVGGAQVGGYVNVYEKKGSKYELKQIFKPTESANSNTAFGESVGISKDGSTVVVGDLAFNNFNGAVYLGSVDVSTGDGGENNSGKGGGDPHFTTFYGRKFDYHGECDIVLLSSPGFAFGSGLVVHVRTKRMSGRLISYSYISAVAVSIGNNVFEVQEDGTLVMNGKRYSPSHDKDETHVSLPTKFGTYQFKKNMIGKFKKISQYVLKLNNSVEDVDPLAITIHANPRTNMLFVKIDGNFLDSVGLLGTSSAGDNIVGRDGVTDMSKDWNAYGEEWQVRDTEPQLFEHQRAPQFPEACVYHAADGGVIKKTHNLRRRLLADGGYVTGLVTMEAAKNACADYTGENKENCVYDVMVMQDLEVAEDPFYNS